MAAGSDGSSIRLKQRALRQIQTLGLALAQNYAEIDGELAARTFVHLWRIDPHVTVTIGAAKHPLRFLRPVQCRLLSRD